MSKDIFARRTYHPSYHMSRAYTLRTHQICTKLYVYATASGCSTLYFRWTVGPGTYEELKRLHGLKIPFDMFASYMKDILAQALVHPEPLYSLRILGNMLRQGLSLFTGCSCTFMRMTRSNVADLQTARFSSLTSTALRAYVQYCDWVRSTYVHLLVAHCLSAREPSTAFV